MSALHAHWRAVQLCRGCQVGWTNPVVYSWSTHEEQLPPPDPTPCWSCLSTERVIFDGWTMVSDVTV